MCWAHSLWNFHILSTVISMVTCTALDDRGKLAAVECKEEVCRVKTHWFPARLAAGRTSRGKAQATGCCFSWLVQAESHMTFPHVSKSHQTLSVCQDLAKCFHCVTHVQWVMLPLSHHTGENRAWQLPVLYSSGQVLSSDALYLQQCAFPFHSWATISFTRWQTIEAIRTTTAWAIEYTAS